MNNFFRYISTPPVLSSIILIIVATFLIFFNYIAPNMLILPNR